MKTFPLLLILLSFTGASAAPLFFDSFESYTNKETDSNGAPTPTWTRDSANHYVTNSTASDGSQSMFMRNGAPQFSELWLTSAVNIDNTATALVFSFDFKAAVSNGTDDGLHAFDVDFGSGYEKILTDFGVIEGADATYTGTPIVNASTASGSGSPFVNYTITVPKSYYLTAPTFKMKFTTAGGGGTQNFYIDNVSVTAIPEPSSLLMMLGGLSVLIIAGRVRKKRA